MAVTPDAGGLHSSGSCAAEAAKTQARTSPQPGTFRPQPAFSASLIFMAFWSQYNRSLESLTSSIKASETASLWGQEIARSFRHGDHAIRLHIPQRLPYPGRPANLDLAGGREAAQAEVCPWVARRRVTSAGGYLVVLPLSVGGGDADLRADSHPVALCANQFEQQPVVVVFRDVAKQLDGTAQLGHDKIDAAIVIEIAIRQTTMGRRTREILGRQWRSRLRIARFPDFG